MSEQNYANVQQQAELMKYISDNMKIPVLGAGGGFAPIGTINFFDATVAPLGWLACDGSIHNISDYPDLATFYASQHGASNYYGGNGTTTFAVPNLQGEFLRGAGTNGHANQGDGANVGVHQDGTLHYDNIMYDYNGTHYIGFKSGRTNQLSSDNKDFYTEVIGKSYASLGTATNSDVIRDFTSRPTNTSFLICIKATVSDAEINAFNVYTPREHQVAWWEEKIDGVWKRKPVYEKRVDCGALPNNAQKTITHNIENIDMVISCRGFCVDSYHSSLNIPHISTSQGQIGCYANRTTLFVYTDGDRTDFNGDIAIQYTKSTDQWQTS